VTHLNHTIQLVELELALDFFISFYVVDYKHSLPI